MLLMTCRFKIYVTPSSAATTDLKGQQWSSQSMQEVNYMSEQGHRADKKDEDYRGSKEPFRYSLSVSEDH